MTWTDSLPIKLVNVVVFFALLGSNIYSVAGPRDAYKHNKETWVTPSYYANYSWSLIHLLLLFLMFFQFTERGKQLFVDTVQWRFALLAILNQAFVWCWYKHWFIAAFILSLFVSAVITQLWFSIKNNESMRSQSTLEELIVHVPFSLWHGWSLVLVVLSAFQAFGKSVDAHHGHPGVWTKIFVFLALMFLTSTASSYAAFSRDGDPAAGAIIAFYLFALFIHRKNDKPHNTFMMWVSLIFFILSLAPILHSAFLTWRKGGSVLHDEEREPLVSGDN